MEQNLEVVGSNPTGVRAFSSLLYHINCASFIQVPLRGATLLIFPLKSIFLQFLADSVSPDIDSPSPVEGRHSRSQSDFLSPGNAGGHDHDPDDDDLDINKILDLVRFLTFY